MEIISRSIAQLVQVSRKATTSTIGPSLKYLLLPLLAAAYPALFFYGNNVHELLLADLVRTLIIYLLIAVIVFAAFLAVNHKAPYRAAIAALIFLIFFNLYGLFENLFLTLNWFTVYDFIVLPAVLLLTGYSIWFTQKLKDQVLKQIWSFGIIIFGGLVVYNLAIILPVEVARLQKSASAVIESTPDMVSAQRTGPDIYYIVLDEFSGFAPMRKYMKDPVVDKFSDFLVTNGFTVYEDSHGNTPDTITELSSRLNFQTYTYEEDTSKRIKLLDLIADNRAMNYLKNAGYSIVTFNEMQFNYSSAPTIPADVTFNYGDIPSTNLGTLFSDFGMMVADNTMLNVFSSTYKRIGVSQHTNMVFFTVQKVGDLKEVKSPKFVYVHLLFPHAPYIFDENGYINSAGSYTDYRYYPGNYKFSIFLAQKMVYSIISSSSPLSPPVIILQSDHGLRNYADTFGQSLEGFSEKHYTNILYARLMPGFEPTFSAQEMDPINTFPIVFNYLFDAGIPLQ